MKLPAVPILLVALLTAVTHGQQPREWWPGTTYDPKIPTPASALGYEIGDYWTEHADMTAYMRRLEAASNRVKVFSVGRSIEKRELLLVAVSAPENIARLEDIRTAIVRLRDPRNTTPADARAIAKATPAIAWMNFANDGNESAAFETAIQLAYHLAAGADETSRRILENVVTIVYPSHNPESHSRHVAWMRASAMGNPDPAAQEHRGDWRMDTNNNHFQIDLNRDAVFLSQQETRVAVRELHRWNPVVFIDHHGNPDRFFFPPWALPVNAQLNPEARTWVEAYGRNIAAAFDRNAWTYFTRQVYDLHYPGYWDSYPALNGATGMTFETDGGGSKGLAYRLPDGRITTLFDGVLRHFTGAMATLVTTAERREERLMALYDFRASGMAEAAREKVGQFVLVPGRDATRAADVVGLLLQHGIEVYRSTAAFTSPSAHDLRTDQGAKRGFDPGVYVVPAGQPQKRLLRTILDRETPLEEAFLKEVRAAKTYNDSVGEGAPRKPYGFYDINAWSLPLAYGIEAYWTTDTVPVASLERVTARPATAPGAPPRAKFAYLFPWNSRGATRLVSALWKEKFQVALAREPFTLNGRAFPGGTVVVRTLTNPDTLHGRIAELAKTFEVDVAAADRAMVEAGRDLGDRTVVDLKVPKAVVVSEPPASSTAYGAIWFLLEEQYGVPFTAIKAQDLLSSDLTDYNVIVLPDGQAGGYARVFGEEGVRRLRAWVENGGTLVAIKGAAAWASSERVNLTTARDKFAEPQTSDQDSGKPQGEPRKVPRRIDTVPGAFVDVAVDADHYLGTGIEGSIVALFRSNIVFTPSRRGARVATLHKERPLVAGFAFDEALPHLASAPYAWDEPTGRGHVTLFADDPTFRTFLHAAHRLLLNAVLLGPSM
ncbi:MAG TPA: M14 family metallopeptidase [Vicinamibacterales bacterium]|nr:M14 family metallopeptidase [Vicinamibacterales bacterium]